MTYVELIFRRYWKYKNKGYSDKKIIIKFIFYNFRLLFNKKTDCPDGHNQLYINNDRKLVIAFRTNGGFGNVLIHANFIKCFYEKFRNHNLNVVVFGHPSSEINEAIFDKQDFVTAYYNYTDLKKEDFSYYDAVIDIHSFPDILKADWNKIHGVNPALFKLFDKWKRFRDDDHFSRFFTLRPLLNSQIYKYSILNNKTCFNVADIDNALNMPDDYILDIHINKDEEKRLQEFGLIKDRFITIQRGVNPFSGTIEAPKMWPVEHFNTLIKLLKNRYKGIKIVQLGESPERCKTLHGIDVNLIGKTDWDDLKILLKNALYHIDGECGMVHLRKALKTGPSVVLFGPTPIKFFSYSNNINITADICPACAGLTDNWQKKCLIGNALCMSSITPQLVIEKIDAYEHKLTVSTPKSLYEKIIGDSCFSLDSIWVQNWLSKQNIFAYEIIELTISELKIFKYENHQWVSCKLFESPAVHYLEGNRKEYIEYCNYKNTYNPSDAHSPDRFEKLITDYHPDLNSVSIAIDAHNRILDGQHRAAIIFHHNPLSKVKVLKLYGDF